MSVARGVHRGGANKSGGGWPPPETAPGINAFIFDYNITKTWSSSSLRPIFFTVALAPQNLVNITASLQPFCYNPGSASLASSQLTANNLFQILDHHSLPTTCTIS